ncbi:MAG: MFS transporter, partial [Archangium sp.]|nr:MFS transporter [Archangium sp.]
MPGPSAAPLAIFYLLYFCTVGVLLPFLPAYLRALGLSASEAGVAQAVSPVVMLVVPPLWGHLADRTGRHGRVLVTLCLGTGAGLVLLWFATSLPEVLLALAINAAFASAVVPMA